MAWGKDGGNTQGPWGKPPGGGMGSGTPGGSGKGGGKAPPPPDFEALLRKSHDRFRNTFPGGAGGNKRLLGLGALVLLGLWLGSGVYLVKADEQGVVTRFGAYHRSSPPGIGYRLPFPFESVATPKVTAVNRIEIGYNSGLGGRNGKTAAALPEESLMLTGDENIVDVNFEVQWKIAKAEDFLFNVRNPEFTVKAVAESAMREVVGRTAITTVMSEGKLGTEQAAIEFASKKLLQDTLDAYRAGVEVVAVNLLKVDPPAQVIEAFRDVQSARLDMETTRNQAEAYRQDILPRARGEAQKMVLDAEAYKQEVVSRARGEASRFAAVYGEYRQARDVTRKRIYMETMEDILHGMQKVVLDNKQGALPYLPLNALKPASGKAEESK